MGRDRYHVGDPAAPHFLTCTALLWLPLFAPPANARILLDSLQCLQTQGGLTIDGYVILENHCHLLGESRDIGKTMPSFKSFTAAQIIKRLTERQSPVLGLLAFQKAGHKTDRAHQVWQEGSHPEQVEGEAMMLQKLAHIHNNPVARGYVDDPVHWQYSSARNDAGLSGLIEVTTAW